MELFRVDLRLFARGAGFEFWGADCRYFHIRDYVQDVRCSSVMSPMAILLAQKAVRWRVELRLRDLSFHAAYNRGLAQSHKRGPIGSCYRPYTSSQVLEIALTNRNATLTCLR